MTTEVFNKLVKSPTSITDEELKQLEVLVWNAPYCQLAYMLVAKGYFDRDTPLKNRKLKSAATVVPSRKKLKQILFQAKPMLSEDVKEEEKPFVKTAIRPITTNPVQDNPSRSEEKELTAKPDENITNEVEQNIQLLKSLRESGKKPNVITEQDVKKTSIDIEPEVRETIPKKSITEEVIKTIPTKNTSVKKTSTVKNKAEKPTLKKSTTKGKTEDLQTPKTELNKSNIQEVLNDEVTMYSSRLGDKVEEELTSAESTGDGDFLLDYLDNIRTNKHPVPKKSHDDIINNFIENDPSIGKLDQKKKPKEQSINDLSKLSYKENLELVSENLAKINIRQGNINKAITIYESLILKNPQKKTYFAKQIEKLSKK